MRTVDSGKQSEGFRGEEVKGMAQPDDGHEGGHVSHGTLGVICK